MAKASQEPKARAGLKSPAPPAEVKSAAPAVSSKKTTKTATKQPRVSAKKTPILQTARKTAAPAAAKRPTAKGKGVVKKAAASKISPPRKAAAQKAAAPARIAAKQATLKPPARRRPAPRAAEPIQPARRGRQAPPPRKAPSRPATPQVFTVSHLNQDDFKVDGLRAYARYRDLGIAAATGGLCQAHVIRFIPPCTEEVRKRHVHEVDLQLIYVLQGWMKNEFEGHGEQMMSAGSCWLQPSGIRHTVLDYSPDCEVLEIIVPANFKTKELA